MISRFEVFLINWVMFSWQMVTLDGQLGALQRLKQTQCTRNAGIDCLPRDSFGSWWFPSPRCAEFLSISDDDELNLSQRIVVTTSAL